MVKLSIRIFYDEETAEVFIGTSRDFDSKPKPIQLDVISDAIGKLDSIADGLRAIAARSGAGSS